MRLRIFALVILISSFFATCNNADNKSKGFTSKEKKIFNAADYEREKQEIISLEDSLISMAANPDSKLISQELLTKSLKFADNYPRDKYAIEFLFMAARAANGLGEYTKSIDILNRIIKNYPDYYRSAEVYFFKAFTYDEDLNDIPKAKNSYIAVIKKFPKDPLAEQAKLLLENLYLTDEELIEKYK